MMHPKQLLAVIACSVIAYSGRSQSFKRGLIAKATTQSDSSENSNRFEILILNPTDSIAYITHSYHILLLEGLEPDVNQLVPLFNTRDTGTYALYYSFRDSQVDDENYPPRLAAFLLPHQFMRFSGSLLNRSAINQLALEYTLLPDFCYRAAIRETQQHNWMKKYRMKLLYIPFEKVKK